MTGNDQVSLQFNCAIEEGKVNISLQRNFVISLMDKLCILSLTELRMVIITLELGKMLLGTGV